MTPRALLAAVRRTALVRFIDSGAEISFDQAEREAAREIAAEQRAQPRAATLVAAAPDGPITIRNAREHLIARVMALATRMRDPLRATVARERDAPGVVASRPERVGKSNKP